MDKLKLFSNIIVAVPHLVGLILMIPLLILFSPIALLFSLYETCEDYLETGIWKWKWM